MRYIAKRRYGVKIEQTRRDFLKTAALSVTAMGLTGICMGEKSLSWLGSAKRAKTGGTLPNFVIIFLDDSGWADFKPFSTPAYETPNVEQLAKGGCCFHNFYVTQAVCSASRASLLAGCYPGRTKVFGAHAPRARGLDPKCATIGEVQTKKGRRRPRTRKNIKYHWSKRLGLIARAMVIADEILFVAGPPELLSTNSEALSSLYLSQAQATYEGKQGALLYAVSASDCRKLAEHRLESVPVFDGMAAAYGRLYISMKDGSLRCWRQ